MAKEYGYEEYRKCLGKIVLSNKDHENICKFLADKMPLEDIQKYVPISEEDFNKLKEDIYFQARLKHLKKTRNKDIQHNYESLKKYSIDNLIELSRSCRKDQTGRISALKNLWEIAKDLAVNTPVEKDHKEQLSELKSAMNE